MSWQRNGHKIQRCDASTGHVVTTVAMVEDAMTAQIFIDGFGLLKRLHDDADLAKTHPHHFQEIMMFVERAGLE